MKSRVIAVAMALIISALSQQTLYAADNEKMPAYYESAKALIEKLTARGDDTRPFTDDILVAQNYLRNAESEYKKNLSWGKLEKSAEPQVKYYAAMAELQAGIVASRLARIDQERERQRLERLTVETRGKIKVFDDKNAEIERLSAELAGKKGEAANLGKELAQLKSDKASQEATLNAAVTGLNSDVAAKASTIAELEKQLVDKNRSLETLTIAQKKTSEELQSLTAQKGAEFVDVQAKLRLSERFREMLADAGKIAPLLRFTDDRITMVYPRSRLFKVSGKGATLVPEAGQLLTGVAGLMQKYPDYRAVVNVHGSGQPAKNEDAKATDAMAKQLKGYLVEKGKLDAALVDASGAGTGTPLFPADAAVANRRVEITLLPAGK
jgi:outer membrane protein OmpA-like peptidoglycan-associated protein